MFGEEERGGAGLCGEQTLSPSPFDVSCTANRFLIFDGLHWTPAAVVGLYTGGRFLMVSFYCVEHVLSLEEPLYRFQSTVFLCTNLQGERPPPYRPEQSRPQLNKSRRLPSSP